MGNPKFKPRDWAVDPDLFGRSAAIEWKRPSGEIELREQFAARVQNLWASRIRARLRLRKIKISAYAARTGKGYDRLSKVLRGDVLMRIEDIADAEFLLDGGIVTGLRDELDKVAMVTQRPS